MKKKLLTLTTLALLLGACDDKKADGSTSTTSESGTTTSAEGGAATAGGEGEIIPTKTGTDTLVILSNSDIPTLDPGVSYDTSSGEMIENMYETLITYKGGNIDQFEPLLATEMPEEVNGGLEYRVKLRDGVKFHSGNPMTCADAEYTFRRNLVTNSSESGNWFLAESLLGTGENAADNPDTVTWAAISNAVKCDGEVLVFTLPKVDPAFISKLAYSGQSVVDSKHAKEIGEWDGTEATWKDWVGKDLKTSELAKKPSGTGAYQLVNADASTVTFKAFEDYWGGAPAIKNVVRKIIPEESSRLQAFLQGDADLADLGSREVIEEQVAGQPGIRIMDDLASTSAYGFAMNEQLEGSTNIGSGNFGDGVPTNFFQDPNIRKCFSAAFDYQAYIDQVLRGKGGQRNFLLPNSFLGYDESITPPAHDLAKAEEYCKAAHNGQAWEKGFTLNAAYRQGSTAMQTFLEILKQNIEGLNPKFKLNIVGKEWSEIIDPKNKEAMVYVGWAPDYADPDNFVHTFYHTKGYYNKRSNMNDPEIDAWIDEARNTTDEAKRKELYSKVAQKALDESYYLVLPVGLGITASHYDLQGISKESRNPMRGGGYLWKNLSKVK